MSKEIELLVMIVGGCLAAVAGAFLSFKLKEWEDKKEGRDWYRIGGMALFIVLILTFGAYAEKLYYTTNADANAYNDVIPYFVDSVPEVTKPKNHWIIDTLSNADAWVRTDWVDMTGDAIQTSSSSSSGTGLHMWGHEREPDSTTHYWTKLDTTAILHKIICDTTQIKKYSHIRPVYTDTMNARLDTITVVEYMTSCDSLYILKIKPMWKKKVAMLLTPKEIVKLREMLLPDDRHPDDTLLGVIKGREIWGRKIK